MDFPVQINKIRMGLSIIYFKGSQVGFSKYFNYELQSLNVIFILANSAGPDEMLHLVHFIWVFTVCQSTP